MSPFSTIMFCTVSSFFGMNSIKPLGAEITDVDLSNANLSYAKGLDQH